MKILFYTFPEGHLVSDKEFARLQKGFAKAGMELIRWHKDKGIVPFEWDITMVKGWSHTYDELPTNDPIVYYSIGAELKLNADTAINTAIKELWEEAAATVHISQYCYESHQKAFKKITPYNPQHIIIPACEPMLPAQVKAPPLGRKLKLATTCIPRPVKRMEQLEALCEKNKIELVTAYGTVSDFSYYHEVDGFISLSRKEGMPNCVLEALAYGLPCIVTNYGGGKEAVADGGIVIKTDPDHVPWDPSNIELVDEMLFEDAISKFRTNLWTLQLNVRRRVLTELNDYVAACKFKEVFEQCLR